MSTILQDLSQFDFTKNYLHLRKAPSEGWVPEVVNPHWVTRFCLWLGSLLHCKPVAYRLDRVAREVIRVLEEHKDELQKRPNDSVELVGKLSRIVRKNGELNRRFTVLTRELHDVAALKEAVESVRNKACECSRREIDEARQTAERKIQNAIQSYEKQFEDLQKGNQQVIEAARTKAKAEIATLREEAGQKRKTIPILGKDIEKAQENLRRLGATDQLFEREADDRIKTQKVTYRNTGYHDSAIICREDSGKRLTFLTTVSSYLGFGGPGVGVRVPFFERAYFSREEDTEESESVRELKPHISRTHPKVNMSFDLTQWPESIIRAYLDFLHNGRKQKHLTNKLAEELYPISCFLQDGDLEQKCFDILKPQLENDAGLLLVLSRNYERTSLLNKKAVKQASMRITTIANMIDFPSITLPNLLAILRSEDLKVSNEEEVLSVASEWFFSNARKIARCSPKEFLPQQVMLNIIIALATMDESTCEDLEKNVYALFQRGKKEQVKKWIEANQEKKEPGDTLSENSILGCIYLENLPRDGVDELFREGYISAGCAYEINLRRNADRARVRRYSTE